MFIHPNNIFEIGIESLVLYSSYVFNPNNKSCNSNSAGIQIGITILYSSSYSINQTDSNYSIDEASDIQLQ